MSREIRPRFEVESDERMDALLSRMAARLRSADCPLCGIAAEGRIELYVPPSRQRLWSPELRVELSTTDGGTLLSGTYGPHPHLWAAYVALFLFSFVSGAAALTFAFAEWSLRQPLTALYALPPVAVILAVTYALAFVGQGLATDEMDELRAYLDEVVFSSVPLPSGVRSRIPDADRKATRRAV